MINYFYSKRYRPEKGWDPVPSDHIKYYSTNEWSNGIDQYLIDHLELWVGGFTGKKVLDLGGGPGHYSVAFALRGAEVTWHDISAGYRDIAVKKAQEHGVKLNYSLGYLDEARNILDTSFDLVFNRICWYYSFADLSFAREIYSLVKPGGIGYVDTTHSGWQRKKLSSSALIRTWLNDTLSLKIGHPYPPHNRIAQIFSKMPIETLLIDYSAPTNDRVIFRRSFKSE